MSSSSTSTTTTAEWVARNLATAPPLGDQQLRRLAVLLNPAGVHQAAAA
jgi:hypothetical protein